MDSHGRRGVLRTWRCRWLPKVQHHAHALPLKGQSVAQSGRCSNLHHPQFSRSPPRAAPGPSTRAHALSRPSNLRRSYASGSVDNHHTHGQNESQTIAHRRPQFVFLESAYVSDGRAITKQRTSSSFAGRCERAEVLSVPSMSKSVNFSGRVIVTEPNRRVLKSG
jgi:hypothetical protein